MIENGQISTFSAILNQEGTSQMQNYDEKQGIMEDEKGYFREICCRIIGNYGGKEGKMYGKEEFCRLMF